MSTYDRDGLGTEGAQVLARSVRVRLRKTAMAKVIPIALMFACMTPRHFAATAAYGSLHVCKTNVTRADLGQGFYVVMGVLPPVYLGFLIADSLAAKALTGVWAHNATDEDLAVTVGCYRSQPETVEIDSGDTSSLACSPDWRSPDWLEVRERSGRWKSPRLDGPYLWNLTKTVESCGVVEHREWTPAWAPRTVEFTTDSSEAR